jgi:hypothetical protein
MARASELVALRARVERLEAFAAMASAVLNRSTEGGESTAWLAALRAMSEKPFTAHRAMRMSAVLRDALEAAGIFTPRELGWRLRRAERQPIGDFTVQRVGKAGAGVLWRVWVSSERNHSQLSSGA